MINLKIYYNKNIICLHHLRCIHIIDIEYLMTTTTSTDIHIMIFCIFLSCCLFT